MLFGIICPCEILVESSLLHSTSVSLEVAELPIKRRKFCLEHEHVQINPKLVVPHTGSELILRKVIYGCDH